MSDPKDNLLNVVTAMQSLPGWADFEQAFKDKRDSWLADSRDARVYQTHPELVHVMARVAECDDWLNIFSEAQKVIERDSPVPS